MDSLKPFPDINGPFRGSHALAAEWLTTKQLRSGLLARLFRDVYIPRAMDVTHSLRCLGASLIAPRQAVLTGCSAATIHGIELAHSQDAVEFVVPEEQKFVAQRGLDVRRTDVRPFESTDWQEIRIATPMRTTLDVLINTRLRPGLPRTVALLDVLLRAGFVDRDELAEQLARRHDNGIVRARQAVELADPRAESIPESEVRVWLTLAGIPPEVQVKVYSPAGRYLGRLDLAYQALRIAVEYDGEWHERGDQPARDAARRAALRAAGWEFVIITKDMLYGDPRAMVARVKEALRRRSAQLAAA